MLQRLPRISIILKISIFFIAVLIIYGQDLEKIFEKSLEFNTGNISNYVLALPFLIFYVIYSKRASLRIISLHERSSIIIPARDEILGITICIIAIIIFMYNSFYVLEYHILSLVIFSVGTTLLLFNFRTLRQTSFAFILLAFFIPPPLEFINFFVTQLNPITAYLVQQGIQIFGNDSTLDIAGIPQIIVNLQNGISQTFQIGEPSSGLYSMIILSSVGLFIAYITNGKIWKRIVLWLIGFPIIFLFNVTRIVMIIILWYNFGKDVSEAFHAVSGSIMIALDAILLLFIGQKLFGIKITLESKQTVQSTNNKSINISTIPILFDHKSRNFTINNIKKIAILTIMIIFASQINMSLANQTTGVSLATSHVDITSLDGQDALVLFPNMPNWDLEFSGRDYTLEETLRHDLFVFVKYVNKSNQEIHTAIDIGDYPHRLESSLTLPGRHYSSTILAQKDIPVQYTNGRFLAYQQDSKDIVVLYWIKEIPIKTESGIAKKYVEFIVTSNTDYLSHQKLIKNIDDLDGAKDILSSFAKPIDTYWNREISFEKSTNKIFLYGLDSNYTIQNNFISKNIRNATNTNDIKELLKKADILYSVEYNYVDALKIYNQVITIQPTNIPALNGVGNCLVKLNQNDNAIDSYEKVLLIDHSDIISKIGIGNALYNMKKPSKAISYYGIALAKEPQNIDAMIGMAASSFDLDRFEESSLWADKILTIDPTNPSAISIKINLQTKTIKPEIDLVKTKIYGIAYSSYRKDQSPITGPYPGIGDIEDDIKLLSPITEKIRIYGLDGSNQFIPEIAQKYGVKTAVTLLLSGDKTEDDSKIKQAVQLANKYNDTIYTIIVENEGLYRNTLNEERIIEYLDQTRNNLNPKCGITIAEPAGVWLAHPEIAKHVDYVMIHYYPYWAGIDVSDATSSVFEEYYKVKDLFGKDVVIGETGWPSSGRSVNLAVASPENQQKFISDFREFADYNKIEYFLFEAFDEKWKLDEKFNAGGPKDVENHWGLYNENGTLKDSLRTVIPFTLSNTTRK